MKPVKGVIKEDHGGILGATTGGLSLQVYPEMETVAPMGL